MALTASEILKAKLPEGQTLLKLYDRENKSDRAGVAGLFLLLTKSGSKLWKLQYRINGKRTEIALGAFTATTAAEAKAALEQARKDAENIRDNKVAKGIDPVVKIDTTGAEQANSFKVLALKWHAHWSKGVDAETAARILSRLNNDIIPVLGHKLPDDVKPKDVRELIIGIANGVGDGRRFEGKGARYIAERAHGNVSQIFRYGLAHDLCETNPAAAFKPGDVLAAHKTQHRAHIEPHQLPAFLVAIDDYDGHLVRKYALQLMSMLFVRTGELLKAPKTEFDLDNARWTIPSERMKTRKKHIVPLPRQAVVILRELFALAGDKRFIFPGLNKQTENGTLNENTLLDALEKIGYGGIHTGHGFRGLASTILHEEGFEDAHIDLQLAHQKKNKVAASYDHSKYIPQRTELMQWWADYLDAQLAKGRAEKAA